MNRSSKKMKVFEYVFVTVCVVGIIAFKIKYGKENKEIFNDPGYAIGLVEEYNPSSSTVVHIPKYVNKTPRASSVTFNYFINDKLYTNHYSSDAYRVPPEGVKKGEKYLMVYNLKNHEESRMIFDFPIRDSLDLNAVIRDYERSKK